MSGYNPEFQREIDRICARLERDREDDGALFGIVFSIVLGLMFWVAIGLVLL